MTLQMIVYIIILAITSTLSLAQHLAQSRYPGSDDMCEYICKSIAKGLFWPITLWVALVCWWVADTTPHWVEILKVPYSFISENVKHFLKKDKSDVGRV